MSQFPACGAVVSLRSRSAETHFPGGKFQNDHAVRQEVSMSIHRIIANEIDQALHRYGLPMDSPLGAELEKDAVVGGGFEPQILIRRGERLISIDERIGELRNDPNFRNCFPRESHRLHS